MRSERRNLWLGIAVVVAGQIGVLGWMVWDRVHLLSYWTRNRIGGRAR